MSYTADWIL